MQQTKTSTSIQISRQVIFGNTRNRTGPLNDENKLRRKDQKLKRLKKMKLYFINFKTVRYKRSASGNIIQSIFTYKLMRPVNNFAAT